MFRLGLKSRKGVKLSQKLYSYDEAMMRKLEAKKKFGIKYTITDKNGSLV